MTCPSVNNKLSGTVFASATPHLPLHGQALTGLTAHVQVLGRAVDLSPLAPSDGMSITTCSIPATPLVAISTSIRSHLPLREIDIHVGGKVIKAGVIDSGSRISLAATSRSQFRTQQTHPSTSLSPPVHGSGSTRSSNYVDSCASTESPRQRPLVHRPSHSTAHSSLLS